MTPFSFQAGFSANLGIVQRAFVSEWSRNGCRTNFFIQGGIDAPQPWMLRNSPALHGRFRNSEGMFVLCLSLSTVRFLAPQKKLVECKTQCSGWGSVLTIAGKTSGRGQITEMLANLPAIHRLHRAPRAAAMLWMVCCFALQRWIPTSGICMHMYVYICGQCIYAYVHMII